MNIVADRDMPGLELFEQLGRVTRLAGREIRAEDLVDAQILLVRSVTRVGADLLEGTAVRFVGSATIGTDHLDLEWLAGQGIQVAHAPGCNAMAVAEYVLQLVLHWLIDTDREPDQCRAGIVGLGNVGARVADLLNALGMQVLASDPPLQAAGEGSSVRLMELDDLLTCDLLSLHVPLTETGRWPTFHMLEQHKLGVLGADQLLINTCRGAVIDNAALRRRLAGAAPPRVALDVWENEPRISRALFERVWRGTPHIAGHSREGKLRGTWMLYQQCSAWLGREVPAMPRLSAVRQTGRGLSDWRDLAALLEEACPIADDHALLAGSLRETDPGAAFDRLRQRYRERHELAGIQYAGRAGGTLEALLVRLGMSPAQA